MKQFWGWVKEAPWQGIAVLGAGFTAIVTVVVIVIVSIARI